MDLEGSLLGIMGREELEGEVARTIGKFHGLLTREVALRLLAKEKGLMKKDEKPCHISEIGKEQGKISVKAKVRKVWQLAKYSSGKRSRVIEIEDGTGSLPLILWNEDADKGKFLRKGDGITVRGTYEKGGELHLGYSGDLVLEERSGFTEFESLEGGKYAHVRGIITSTEGWDRFIRECAPSRKGYSFFISDGKKEIRCVIWEGIERGAGLTPGDEVILENALYNAGELGISNEGRILSRRKGDMLLGKVESMECECGGLSVTVGGRSVKLDRENALKFLGVEVADDISLPTVAMLKKDSMLNSSVALKAKEKDGHLVIE
uniref:OB domain-containing protein n=1 Tax=Candidatus Methanophaga sp. ANME-1 ERB7 TaxID=2759913 RepID=A0A7G9Z2E9_9EURY|nr:hypothetical protein IPKNHHKO_00007 [Methanosarcinales archaeon ANME-1 ERB7]